MGLSTIVATGLALVVMGCGLVTQGLNQELRLRTDPDGARVEFAGEAATSPATINLPRRSLGFEVIRAEKPGFLPACAVVPCRAKKWIKVVNSILLGIPWIIDGPLGSHRACPTPPRLVLEPIEAGHTTYRLPIDEFIINAHRFYDSNICRHPYLYDVDFGITAERILITTGNLQRPYSELGPVDFSRSGSDVTRWSTTLGHTRAVRTFSKASPLEVNSLLQRRALFMYGDKVDAVINVDYQTNPRNDVFGTGLAVRFTTDQHSKKPAVKNEPESRLRTLRELLNDGLISQQEYDDRRTKILDEL